MNQFKHYHIIEFIRYISNDFCHPVKVTIAGEIVGVGCAIIHDTTAWLAHIIVAEDHRNTGVGYTIVNYLIDQIHQNNKINSVLLIATQLGEPLYRKAGFRLVCEYTYWEKSEEYTPFTLSGNFVQYNPEFKTFLKALDLIISGEYRWQFMQAYLQDSVLYIENKKVQGIYLPTLGEAAIFAINQKAGTELLKLRFYQKERVVVPQQNTELQIWLRENGFALQDTIGRRMILGDDIAWNPEAMFGRIGGNYG